MLITVSRLCIAACVLVIFGVGDASAQSSLGTAESFAVLAGSGVTNTGPSLITGDLGTHPTASVTGFPPGVVTGTIHAADATADQAKTDLVGQYNALTAAACTSNLTGQNLGNRTLTPGVYCFDTSAQLTGTLTLNAQGNPAAQFIFKTGSTLTTAGASQVLLINGGNPCRVAWRIGSSATLGTTTSFIGNLIALTSITLTTDANIIGRALARNGAVTLDSNDITFAACGAAVPPVPTLSQWMTILLAGLLCVTAIVALRRRQQVVRS
jgi:hypothetical protein